MDEAMLARNIIDRDFVALTQTLDHVQMAPVGFLWVSRTFVLLFSDHEYALRLFPLLSGLAALVLMYYLLRTEPDRLAALVSLFLFCFSFRMAFFASEVKPYATDVLCALLCFVTYKSADYMRQPLPKVMLYGLVGAIVSWFSFTSVFVLAAMGLYQAWILWRNGQWQRHLPALMLTGGLWGASFLLNFLLIISKSENRNTMNEYWADAFMPLPVNLEAVNWYLDSINELFYNTLGIAGLGWLIFFMVLWGLASLIAAKRYEWLALILPLLFMYLLSALKLYPFSGRLLMFLSPMLALLAGYGVAEAWRSISQRWLRLALLVLIVFQPLAISAMHLLKPYEREELKQALNYYQAQRMPGDVLYIFHSTGQAFAYYKNRYNLGGVQIIQGGYEPQNQGQELDKDSNELRKHQRAWLVFTHDFNREDQILLSKLEDYTELKDQKSFKGAQVYLIEIKQTGK
jgi:4-amino-4-deoxy-L-arabinose transferase-like glycosyltransferase